MGVVLVGVFEHEVRDRTKLCDWIDACVDVNIVFASSKRNVVGDTGRWIWIRVERVVANVLTNKVTRRDELDDVVASRQVVEQVLTVCVGRGGCKLRDRVTGTVARPQVDDHALDAGLARILDAITVGVFEHEVRDRTRCRLGRSGLIACGWNSSAVAILAADNSGVGFGVGANGDDVLVRGRCAGCEVTDRAWACSVEVVIHCDVGCGTGTRVRDGDAVLDLFAGGDRNRVEASNWCGARQRCVDDRLDDLKDRLINSRNGCRHRVGVGDLGGKAVRRGTRDRSGVVVVARGVVDGVDPDGGAGLADVEDLGSSVDCGRAVTVDVVWGRTGGDVEVRHWVGQGHVGELKLTGVRDREGVGQFRRAVGIADCGSDGLVERDVGIRTVDGLEVSVTTRWSSCSHVD